MSSEFGQRLLAGRRYAVVGLGRNGLPAARRLASMGAEVSCWDDRQARRAAATGLHVHEPVDMSGVDALVLSPGIALDHRLARDATARSIPVLSDAALLHEAVRLSGSCARFVGITGTNGKSTTTVLLAHLLAVTGIETAAGGNLGPASLALPLLGDAGIYLLEMSSYMLERVPDLHFDAAALLNISPDHLDRHGGMDGYIAAKRSIFANRRADDVAVIGVDDRDSARIAAALRPAPVTVSGVDRDAEWRVHDGALLHRGAFVASVRDCTALQGAHNRQNAAAACALAVGLGVAPSALASGLSSFEGLPHRQKRIATLDGVTFVDDSKATNADAAARALGCMGRCIWIAGGLAKDGGIDPLAPVLGDVAEALLIGRDAAMFARTLAAHDIAHRVAGTLDDAVPMAFEAARRTGARIVLLSPAAASFDQFADFEARGRRFAELVGALASAGNAA